MPARNVPSMTVPLDTIYKQHHIFTASQLSVCLSVPIEHGGLGSINNDVQNQDGAQIELEFLIRNHSVTSVQLPFLEEESRPVEFRVDL